MSRDGAANVSADVARAAARVAPRAVRDIRPASSGANSSVFKIDCGGEAYALKRYPRRGDGARDRRRIEWWALSFMTARGLAQVPRPLALDDDERFALMEWIEGRPITGHRRADLDDALAFMAAVFGLSDDPQAGALAAAAEPCLSADAIIGQIEHRVSALIRHRAIDRFLQVDLNPADQRAVMALPRTRTGSDLAPGLRRLIPADFGFHNALREPNGRLRYVDFDYFGWDDPVKLAADVILHPAMMLPSEDALHVAIRLSAATRADDDFTDRLCRYLPLFAVRWALILLNPFRVDRMRDCGSAVAELDSALQARLARARTILGRGWKIQALIGDYER